MSPEQALPPVADYRRAHETLDVLIGMVEASALVRQRSSRPQVCIPVVIVAGSLGAGKTTLLRHVLRTRNDQRIAVLVNDVASLNIDADLIREVSADTTELANGCVCCSISGSMAKSLVDIVERTERPDVILLECSGVSDPWPIAQVIGTIPDVELDSIITVVDAGLAISGDLKANQIRAADLVLLNKWDLVTAAEASALTARIASISPRSQVLRTRECAVPASVVFGHTRMAACDVSATGPVVAEADSFSTAVLVAGGPVDRTALERCIEGLPDGVLRVKGFVELRDDTGGPKLFQAVGRRWRWHEAPPTQNAGHLVVIGRDDCVRSEHVLQHFLSVGFSVPAVGQVPD